MTARLLPLGLKASLLSLFFVLRLFAQSQTDVNHQDYFGVTELMHAARAGDATRVKALIVAGANVNLTSKTGWTPLLGAAVGGDVEVARELIQAGANLNATETHTGRTPLIYAVLWRRTQVAEALIQAGADLSIALPRGETALISAALSGQSEIVQALIKAGANLNQKGKNGASAFTLAAWNWHQEVVRELMKAGARPESTAWRKTTPPQFEDFPVGTVYTGPRAPVNLGSNPEAHTYRTRLTEGAKAPVNFAGHYIVVGWGCGTQCGAYMLIDAKNGKVFDGPAGSDPGVSFRANSSLFVVEADPARYYRWKDGTLILIYQQACHTTDGQQECGCNDVQRLLFEARTVDKSDVQR